MTALDDIIESVADETPDHEIEAASNELAQLRDNLSTAQEELKKWRNWKPDDETLAFLQKQARDRSGSYTNSLAACVAYIGAFEARLREQTREA